MSYCTFCQTLPPENVNRHYHDHDYGFPISDDNALFERLVLEINQAGLSWQTILKKKENFQRAFDGFAIARVADYNDADRERLLGDAGIIRNRLKVNAAIENAKRIVVLQNEHGSFKRWLEVNHPKTKDEWVKLFKRTFVFTGGEIVNEFLMSTGYLPCPHDADCSVRAEIEQHNPPWMW